MTPPATWPAHTTDQTLVDAARSGDRQALELLLRRHHDRIHLLCRRLCRHRQDAEDATQHALIAIVRGLPGFDGRSAFTTWSHRIATNACLDELRRRGRRALPADPHRDPDGAQRAGGSTAGAAGGAAAAPDPAEAVVGGEQRRDLQQALEQLPRSSACRWCCATWPSGTTPRSRSTLACHRAPCAHASHGVAPSSRHCSTIPLRGTRGAHRRLIPGTTMTEPTDPADPTEPSDGTGPDALDAAAPTRSFSAAHRARRHRRAARERRIAAAMQAATYLEPGAQASAPEPTTAPVPRPGAAAPDADGWPPRRCSPWSASAATSSARQRAPVVRTSRARQRWPARTLPPTARRPPGHPSRRREHDHHTSGGGHGGRDRRRERRRTGRARHLRGSGAAACRSGQRRARHAERHPQCRTTRHGRRADTGLCRRAGRPWPGAGRGRLGGRGRCARREQHSPGALRRRHLQPALSEGPRWSPPDGAAP